MGASLPLLLRLRLLLFVVLKLPLGGTRRVHLRLALVAAEPTDVDEIVTKGPGVQRVVPSMVVPSMATVKVPGSRHFHVSVTRSASAGRVPSENEPSPCVAAKAGVPRIVAWFASSTM